MSNHTKNTGHAIVIGGTIAGLLTASVRIVLELPKLISAVVLLAAMMLGTVASMPRTAQAAGDATPPGATSPGATIIVWTNADGFAPAVVNIRRGDTVIWRNQGDAQLTLRSGMPHSVFLPMIASNNQVADSTVTAQQISAPPSFDAVLNPGEEYSVQFTSAGAFSFFDAGQSSFVGTVNVTETPLGSAVECALSTPGSGNADGSLPGVTYATSEERTLLRWFWDDCATANFQVYRSENGAPEMLVATVTPQTDALAAEALLNTTDARWPNLSTQARNWILQADDFSQETTETEIGDLFDFLYSNGLAGVHLTNQYYPLALMLGWGYVDTAITPGAEYIYRVVAVTGGPGGTPLEMGSVKLTAGQRTPMIAPTNVTTGTLDIVTWDGNWGLAQRNRRYDGQIYLNWETDNPAQDASALIIGYDVFAATTTNDAGLVVDGKKVVDVNADDSDAIVVPGPVQATDGVDYLFRYAPGNYDTHTLCVGPRDLLNQPIRWPQDASQCSAPIIVAAADYLPPPAPQNVIAAAMNDSAQVNLTWEQTNAGDVARFIIQRSKEMHCKVGACWNDVATVAGNVFAWSDLAALCANDPLDPQGCWYRVVASDGAGNRSAPSRAVYAIIHDTTPPGQLDIFPTTCENPANPANSQCVNIISDAVSIRLNCRFSPDGEEIFLTDIDAADFLGLDWVATIKSIYQPPLHLQKVMCRLILSDEYGNLSDIDAFPAFPVKIDSDNPDQLTQPIITQIESVFVGAGDWDAAIHWEMAAHPMLGEFVIEREHSGGIQNFVGISPNARNFTDVSVQQGEQYTYRVHAVPSTGGINQTISEPRTHRVLPGENRPLIELAWADASPSWSAINGSASLLVNAGPVAPDGIIHYAVFRSLHAASDYIQITPMLEATGSAVFYQDKSAQRGCYFYVVVTFRTRDGEPTGYTEPRQAGVCSQPQTIYTPGPAAAAPPYPLANCRPAQHSLAPAYNFRFGGGFQVVVEGLNDNNLGPANVSGGGWLLLETEEQTIPVPMSFSSLTVNADGFVCSGTAQVDLSTLPGGGLWLQASGGWPYQVIGISLQPWFGSNNTASATLDIFTGDAFSVGANVGDAAQRLKISGASMTSNLRFSRTIPSLGQPQQCGHPTLAFRLETLPIEVIPTSAVQINESQITMSSACTRYVDRYNDAFPLITSPYSGLSDERFANGQYLNTTLTGGAVTISPAGVNGSFSANAAVAWSASYPFAFQVAVNGLSVNIEDGQISGGSMGAGTATLLHHQTADQGKQATVQATFAGLTIGARGDLTGAVALGGVDWDAFAIPATAWEFYQGALTTPGLPAMHDINGSAQSIMWQSHPTNGAPLAIPGGALPGELEPGFNRRQTGATLAWANCGDTAIFDNVSMDAYLRRSGITQRHIPIYGEGSQMTVYGYQFRPERFDLHFMDNALLESEIDGFVHLPFPSDVDVHLVDIWLTGNSADGGADESVCIGGGRIPAGEQEHTLAYWAVDTNFTAAEFRQTLGEATILWFLGDIRNLVHLTVVAGGAILPAELAFDPDGNFHPDPRNGPKYDRPDYRFQRFPYLMERLRLSNWFGDDSGEAPVWNANATTIAQPLAESWKANGFIGLTGVPVAPYFGPLIIDAAPDGDQIVMAAWDETVTGFAAQPRVSKEWVKLARIQITFDYNNLVHVYDTAAKAGLFVGFKDYRFVPDKYLELPGVPKPVQEIEEVADLQEKIKKLQILQLDTGTVISPTATGVYLGLSAGVAPLRALAEAQAIDPSPEQMALWADKLAINNTAKPVYVQQLQAIIMLRGPFAYEDTTAILDEVSDIDINHLLDVQNVGGRTQGLLAEKGINIHRLRGLVEVEGEGLETQFKRFHLSTQVEIKGRDQTPDQVAPLPADPSGEPEPPLFYAERMTLSIERHGDFMLVGKGIESSKFNDKLESFDATLVINSTKPQFEGGVTLYGLTSGGVSMENVSAVVGVGAGMNYMGISFDGTLGADGKEILIAGDLLAGMVNPESAVLQNNFKDAMAQIEDDLQGEELPDELVGFYLRAYAGQIPIIGNGCLLSLQGDAEIAFWYWQLGGAEENFGGFLNPAVYGRVLCVVDARGDINLRYQQSGGENTFEGEGYIAGGVGKCEPASWGDWADRWWDDGGCIQAGAGLGVSYADSTGWDVSYSADRERLFGD
jgi:plastocyanin